MRNQARPPRPFRGAFRVNVPKRGVPTVETYSRSGWKTLVASPEYAAELGDWMHNAARFLQTASEARPPAAGRRRR